MSNAMTACGRRSLGAAMRHDPAAGAIVIMLRSLKMQRLSDILCSDVICQAIGKRSSNMIASWDLTACHSRTERFHSVDVALSAR